MLSFGQNVTDFDPPAKKFHNRTDINFNQPPAKTS